MNNDYQTVQYEWLSADPVPAHAYLLPAIRRMLPASGNGCRVLDMGCGNGYVAAHLARDGFEVTGFDLSADGIEIAQRQYPMVTFKVASVYDDLTAVVGTGFDWVISSEVIEHLYFPKRLLQGASGVLKDGGGLIVSTPYHGYLKNMALSLFDKWDSHHTAHFDGGHIKFLSERTLGTMLEETGFSNIQFGNAGRVPFLWKSMVCRAQKALPTPRV